MRHALVVIAAALISCGQLVPCDTCSVDSGTDLSPKPEPRPSFSIFGVSMRNEYAESLFTVDVTIEAPPGVKFDGGTPAGTRVRFFQDKRIASYRTEVSGIDALVDPRATLFIEVAATSLGDVHRFTAREPVSDAMGKETLSLLYDYDLALAEFSLRYGWTD